MSRFHYFKQSHYGADRSVVEIDEKEFVKLLGEHYCCDTMNCGGIGISIANYEAAKRKLASLKRDRTDIHFFGGESISLTLRKDRVPPKRRSRDTSYPD